MDIHRYQVTLSQQLYLHLRNRKIQEAKLKQAVFRHSVYTMPNPAKCRRYAEKKKEEKTRDSLEFSRLLNLPNFQLGGVLFQDILVVVLWSESALQDIPTETAARPTQMRGKERRAYFPELLGGILPCNTFEDFGATGVLVDEVGHVVDILVDDNVEALIRGVVGGDVGGSESLRHFGRAREWVIRCRQIKSENKMS